MPGGIGSKLVFPDVLSAEFIEPTDQTPSTSLANGSPLCGLVFAVPPSGVIRVHLGVNMEVSSGGGILRVGWRLRTGVSLGSGSIIDGTEPGSPGDGTHQTGQFRAETRGLLAGPATPARVGGLTPGQDVNLHTYHYLTTGTGVIYARSIMVEFEL